MAFTTLFGLFVLFLGVVAVVYFFFLSGPSKNIPLFESYATRGVEADIKALELRLYDALLDLDIPAQNVQFNKVETRRSKEKEWTYTDLQARLSKTKTPESIQKAFDKNIGRIVPKPRLTMRIGEKKEAIILISYQGLKTHRITVLPYEKQKMPLEETPGEKPKVAIIIDDMGYDRAIAKKFFSLGEALSYSVLPYSPFQTEIANAAHRKGKEVLLHLPMEPIEFPKINPGKGALLMSMEPDKIIEQLLVNLRAVPHIVGVNNHMGSRLTQDSAIMRQVFTVLKRRGLFFIDSVTSPESRCPQAARLLQLKFARRQVFLDHVQEPNAVRLQLKRLVSIAKSRGEAIGIGHPYPVTLKVLENERDYLKNNVHIVSASALVK